MRIVVHGQQAFGKAVLEALIKRGENVVAVYVAPEKEGAKADPFRQGAATSLVVRQPSPLGGLMGFNPFVLSSRETSRSSRARPPGYAHRARSAMGHATRIRRARARRRRDRSWRRSRARIEVSGG